MMVLGELCAVMDFTVMLQAWHVNSWDIPVTLLIVKISKFITNAVIAYEHNICFYAYINRCLCCN